MTDNEKPTPTENDPARDADLERREKTLSEDLDDLETAVKPKKPKAPSIGAMF